eukprot:Rmarinus@m.3507
MMDEDQPMESFSMDRDFEGGVFVGNEFYFEKKKAKRKMTKNDHVYGIFNEFDDSEGEVDPKRSRLQQPVSFVSGGTTGGTAGDKQEDTSKGGLGTNQTSERSGLGSTASTTTPSADHSAPPAPTPFVSSRSRPPARGRFGFAGTRDSVDQDFASFEKHTKGIGSKLLAKMGYKAGMGLGKQGEGIAEPIQVKMRPKGIGVGYGGFDEKTEQQKRHAMEQDMEEGMAQAAQTANEEEMEEDIVPQAWKRSSKHRKKKIVYRSSEDVLAESEGKTLIVDMRGPQTRVITSMEDVKSLPTGRAKLDPRKFPELQHNVKLLVDLAEVDIQKIDRKLRTEKDRLIAIGKERDELEKVLAEDEKRVSRVAEVMKIVEACKNMQGVDMADVIDTFKLLKDYKEEWTVFNLVCLIPPVAIPRLNEYLHQWDPLVEPTMPLSVFDSWRVVIGERPAMANGSSAEETVYAELISETVLPRLRSAATNAWNVRNCEPMVLFMAEWKPVLPPSIYKEIINQLVLPKLQMAVETWNPKTDTVPINVWTHPWLPIVGDALTPLFPSIKYKLQDTLRAWHPADHSAHVVIAPWANVFDRESFCSLLDQAVLPKVAMALGEMPINPANQYLDPFNWLMDWADVVPPQMIASVLERTFFPKWHRVLAHWLSNNPNLEEVQRWYTGWKSLFPDNVAETTVVKRHFTEALNAMNRAVAAAAGTTPSRWADEAPPLPPPLPSEPAPMPPPPLPRSPPRPAPRKPSTADMTLKDLMEEFARHHEIDFYAIPNKYYENNQVYTFGGVRCYLDNSKRLIFAQEKGSWRPTSLQQLLQMTT